MFGSIDKTKTYSVITVKSPVKLTWLHRVVLTPGVYEYPGDITPKLRKVSDMRDMHAGLYKILVVNPAQTVPAVDTTPVIQSVIQEPVVVAPGVSISPEARPEITTLEKVPMDDIVVIEDASGKPIDPEITEVSDKPAKRGRPAKVVVPA
jgi:hypothetical protein